MSSGGPASATGPSPPSLFTSSRDWYANWCMTTPFVARSTLHLLLALYLFSWLVDLAPYVSNIPYLTIYKFQLWRPFLSPFYTEGLLSVVFLCLSLGGMGATLEQVGKEGGRKWPRLDAIVTFSSSPAISFKFRHVSHSLSLLHRRRKAVLPFSA